MAENYRFFDSQIGDVREYNAAEFAEYFETLVDTGLIEGALNELNPTVTGSNMIVTVDTGNAFINGRWYENDNTLDNTFDTETIPNDRIDLLVLRLDLNTNERKITFEIAQGTPSVTPVAPTLTRTSVIYELGLAEIYITGGQSFIDSGDLTDLREITTQDSFSFPTAQSKLFSNKMDKPGTAVSGNIGIFDSNRNIIDGGIDLAGISGSIFITGSYTGDGSASRTINLGFRPKIVYLVRNEPTNALANINFTDFTETSIAIDGFNSPMYLQGTNGKIIEIVSNGFDIFESSAGSFTVNTNTSSAVFSYVAIK